MILVSYGYGLGQMIVETKLKAFMNSDGMKP